MWASDDFLATSTRIPDKHTVPALMTMGAGAGGTRNIAGNSPIHLELEAQIAAFHNQEAGLLVTTRHVAHEAAVTTLAELLPECGIYLSEAASPPIVEAARRSRMPVYPFARPEQLEGLLHGSPHASRLVVLETIRSDGTIEPIEHYREVAQHGGGLLVLDETKAVGVYGERGAGLLELCSDPLPPASGDAAGGLGGGAGSSLRENLVVIGSIDGTLGGLMMGGYVTGKADTIDCIRSFGSSFIFTTALPPAVVKCASHCIEQVEANAVGRKLLADKVSEVRATLLAAGVPLQGGADNPSHILCVPIPSADKCHEAADALLEQGILVEALAPPAHHPQGAATGLRINPTTEHTGEMTTQLAQALQRVASDLRLW